MAVLQKNALIFINRVVGLDLKLGDRARGRGCSCGVCEAAGAVATTVRGNGVAMVLSSVVAGVVLAAVVGVRQLACLEPRSKLVD